MPAAVAATVVAVFGAAGVTSAIVLGAVYWTTYAATVYALQKAAEALSPKPKTGMGASMEVSLIDSSAAGHVVYGEVRKGGVNVIPPITSGSDGRYLHQVLAMAIHECNSAVSVFVDDEEIVAANITAVAGNANDGLVTGSSKYAGAAWLRFYAGTTTQNVDFILNAAYASSFGATWRGRGIAYLAAKFDWGNGKTFAGGVPQLTLRVKGKKCYDPRLDPSPGASPTNPAYIAWTDNPALCWADYKMASTYGQKVVSTEIDWDCVVAAADVCDALVNIPGATTQKRYTFNGVLLTDTDTAFNERLFIDAMVGKLAFSDGKWRVFAGAWRAAAYEIDREDWVRIGAIQSTAGRGDDRYNGVVVYYVDEARNYQRVEAFRRYNDTYKSADGNERVWVELEQPACNDKYEAERKGEFVLRQSRNGIKLTGLLPPRFMRLRTWDNVTLYFDEMGWSGKTFTVASCAISPEGGVEVTLAEEQSTDWTDLAAVDYGAPSISGIPATNPTTPTEPASFAVTPLLGTLQFDFGEPLVRPYGTRYQILQSPGTLAVAGSYAVLWEGDVTRIVLPADVRSTYWYHGRMVSNSYYSPLTPNTFGIGSAPWITPESVPGNRGFPDGELLFASTSYWLLTNSGAVTQTSSIFTGSGYTNQRGYYRLFINSHNNGAGKTWLSPLRYDVNSRTASRGVPMMVGQRGIAYLQVRGVGSTTISNLTFLVSPLRISSPGAALDPLSTLYSATIDEGAVSSGTWTTYIGTFTMNTSFYDAAGIAVLYSNAYGGAQRQIDIGAAQLSVF